MEFGSFITLGMLPIAVASNITLTYDSLPNGDVVFIKAVRHAQPDGHRPKYRFLLLPTNGNIDIAYESCIHLDLHDVHAGSGDFVLMSIEISSYGDGTVPILKTHRNGGEPPLKRNNATTE